MTTGITTDMTATMSMATGADARSVENVAKAAVRAAVIVVKARRAQTRKAIDLAVTKKKKSPKRPRTRETRRTRGLLLTRSRRTPTTCPIPTKSPPKMEEENIHLRTDGTPAVIAGAAALLLPVGVRVQQHGTAVEACITEDDTALEEAQAQAQAQAQAATASTSRP